MLCLLQLGPWLAKMSNSGKLKLEELVRAAVPSLPTNPGSTATHNHKSKSMIHKILRQSDLYHNQDPLFGSLVKSMNLLFWLRVKRPELLLTLSQLSSISVAWVKK